MDADPARQTAPAAAVRWSELTWPEIRRLLADRPTEVGLVPVGATEQHGPHLPAGTDTIVAEAVCMAVSERTGAPVLPSVAVACSYGHGTDLPGTLSLTPELLIGHVVQIATWAAHSGLRRLLLVNAHYGNHAALMVATDHLRLERPDLRVGVVDWWSTDPAVAAEVVTDAQDIHANRAETSLMLAIAPGLVRRDLVATSDDPDRTGGLVFRYTAPSLSTNGVTGRPSEADPALGAKLFEATVTSISDLVGRGRVEEPPLPGGGATGVAGGA